MLIRRSWGEEVNRPFVRCSRLLYRFFEMILQHEREATCHCGMNMSCAGLSRPLEVFVLQSWHLDLDPAVWTCPDSSLETGNCMRSFGMTLSQSPTHPGTIPMPPNSAPRWNGGRDWAYSDVFWLHVLSMQHAMRFCMFSQSNYNVLECPIMLASSPHRDILHHVHLWNPNKSKQQQLCREVGIGPLPNEEGREGTAMDWLYWFCVKLQVWSCSLWSRVHGFAH